MSKRSSHFARKPRDFYPTPLKAAEPLFPHLESGSIYAEPCAGAGALLSILPICCGFASDIEPLANDIVKLSAFDLCEEHLEGVDYIITNPPWDRKLLHPMIEHFSSLRPTWLLFDADWSHTKQAENLMKRCSKIVSVGRVKWIPDSKMTGKDNCSWYLFEADEKPTQFFTRTFEE